MKVADKLAKKACKPRRHPQRRFLLKFTSRSAALTLLERKTKTRWRRIKDDTEIGERSGSYRTFPYLELRLRPPPWFKSISRPIMSRLTQFASNHGYIGEYFHGFNIQKDSYKCPCPSNPPRFQTRSHIIRECEFFDDARTKVALAGIRINYGGWNYGKLVAPSHIEHLIDFLTTSGAFSKKYVCGQQPGTIFSPPRPPTQELFSPE